MSLLCGPLCCISRSTMFIIFLELIAYEGIKMICTDLWPAIISYCDIGDYCKLSLASCLFDPLLKDLVDGPVIFEYDCTGICDGTDIRYKICSGLEIIKTDSGKVMSMRSEIDRVFIGTIPSEQIIRRFNMRIIHTVNEITDDLIKNYVWSLQSGYLLIAYNDNTRVIMRPVETTFSRNKMLRVSLGMFTKELDIKNKLSFRGLQNDRYVIDQVNKVICVDYLDIVYEGYRMLYSDGHWTR